MLQGVNAIPTDEVFAAACKKTGGNLSAMAEIFGVHRNTVDRWVNKEFPIFKEFVDDARESILDLAEDRNAQLIAGIPIVNDEGKIVAWQERPDSGLIKFTLATRGKKRGYGENLALSNPDGSALTINFIRREKTDG